MAMANFDLVALVVQSKRALQHAELICTRTDHDIRSTSALVVEILSNDAKVRWMTDGIAGQLGLATIVAESITARRVALSEQLYQWESERSQRTGALDSMLEMLSQRPVPPALHLNASSSSLFGSQHEFLAEKEPQQPQTEPPTDGNVGASASLEKSRAMTNRTNEKSKWKTLRDFVDERGIDEVIDRMDSERATLEDYLAFTASHADSILARIAEIKARLPIPLSHSIQSQGPSMPSPSTSPSSPSGIKRPFSAMPVDTSNNEQGTASQLVHHFFTQQDALSLAMAQHLEGLARHYDQITDVLRDAGGVIDEHDAVTSFTADEAGGALHATAPFHALKGQLYGLDDHAAHVFQQDTEMLPAIIADIEEAAHQIDQIHESIRNMHQALKSSVDKLRIVMDMLDALAAEMTVKVEDQSHVENDTVALFDSLNSQLGALDELLQTYRQYNLAFDKLVVEMDRRKRTREIVTEELEHMLGRLEQLRDEEISYRERFFQDQGQYLPEDLCPFLADLPPKYLVQTIDDDLLPDLEPSFVAEARKNITTMEGITNSMERSNLA